MYTFLYVSAENKVFLTFKDQGAMGSGTFAPFCTLNKIWLDDHQAIVKAYPKMEEEGGMLKAAEEIHY